MPRSKPNKLQRVILSIPFLLGLAVLVVIVAISAVRMQQTSQGSKETVERLMAEQQELLAREDAVSNAALDISTERGIEGEIREKFSVAKEGERVIVLVDDEDQTATSTGNDQSWWRSILSYIWPF